MAGEIRKGAASVEGVESKLWQSKVVTLSFIVGFDDTSISFGSVEANGRPALNLERRLDHDGHPLAIATVDAVAANGVPPWNWRETPGNGSDAHGQPFGGRVITVKFGDYTRRVGVDGGAEAIKETIRSAFGKKKC